jgi:hypothetical protein
MVMRWIGGLSGAGGPIKDKLAAADFEVDVLEGNDVEGPGEPGKLRSDTVSLIGLVNPFSDAGAL